jgi:hypothetical protein
LRGELYRQLAGQVLAGEFLALTHIGGDDPADPVGFQQQTQAGAVHPTVVGHDRQITRALLQ